MSDGGPAFQQYSRTFGAGEMHGGMSLRDYFAGQALANPTICTGTAKEYELKHWFGGRGGIRVEEIAAAQAFAYANAMLAARTTKAGEI